MEKDLIEDFLKHYESQNTIKSYRRQIKKYFEVIDQNPNTYLDNGRDYRKDIEYYWNNHLRGMPPLSRTQGLTAVKMFLEEYLDENIFNIQLSPKFFKKLKRRAKGTRAITQDKVPTPKDLKTIISHTDCKGKALLLTLATSGMRINEALSITKDDIHLDETPARIEIPSRITKTGEARTTFITDETKYAINEWYKIREDYMKYADKCAKKGTRPENDNRVFPFHYQRAWNIWLNAIKKAKLSMKDKTTDRYKFHIHVLRKFFRSRLPKSIGVDMTEFLMGHENYLTREYRDYPDEELAKEYMKGAEKLLIFETPADTSDLREEMSNMQKNIQELKAELTELRLEKLERMNGIKK